MIVVAKFLWCLIAWIDLIVFTLVMYLLSYVPRKFFGKVYDRLFRVWCRTFIRALGVNLKQHQKYKARLPEQYIVIANHPSALEDIGIPSLFPACSVAKKEVGDWFLLGRISTAADTVYLDREDKDSRAQAAETIKQALLGGKNIAIYPEGGCKGRRIRLVNPFLYGIFTISLETGIPILPVFIHYEAQETFEWQEQSLIQKIKDFVFATNKTANYYVFDPYNPGDFKSREEYTRHVQNQYLEWQEKYLL